MHPGAGGAHDPLVLVFVNIRIVVHLTLDVEAGRRAPENEIGHQSRYDGTPTRRRDLAQYVGKPTLTRQRNKRALTDAALPHAKLCSGPENYGFFLVRTEIMRSPDLRYALSARPLVCTMLCMWPWYRGRTSYRQPRTDP